MQRYAGLATAVLAALVPASAPAKAPSVHQVAAALKEDPVYVAPSKRRQVSASAERRLRRRIARLDKGRIQIAVVPAASAERVGDMRSFTNAVDQALPDRRGSLIGTDGQHFQVITSYRDVDPTLGALRHAVDSRHGLTSELLAGVAGIADVDPGPGQDINGPPGGGGGVAPNIPAPVPGGGSDVGTVVAIVFGALVLLPLLALGLWLLLRWRRQHKAAAEMQELDLGSTRDELVALGQDIEDLDIDTQMPNANPAGLEEYQRALSLYDRANQALGHKDPSPIQIQEAKRAAEEGRQRIAAARTLLSIAPASGSETVPPPP